jgi:fatty-acyl-CoA synthase
MMDYPLTLQHFLERAAKLFPNKEIVTRTSAGTRRYRYRDYHRRAHRLAHALEQLGIKPGDRVGSLCWNTHQHLELYFAVTCYGAVLHTLNLRLSPDDLAFIINHAEDRVIFVDQSLVPILDKIRDRIPCVERCVIIGGDGSEYEQLLAGRPTPFTRGRAWMRIAPPACATPPAPLETPRAWSTAIARFTCTACPLPWPTRSH